MQLGKVVAFLLDLSSSWQPSTSVWLRVCSVGSVLSPGCKPARVRSGCLSVLGARGAWAAASVLPAAPLVPLKACDPCKPTASVLRCGANEHAQHGKASCVQRGGGSAGLGA